MTGVLESSIKLKYSKPCVCMCNLYFVLFFYKKRKGCIALWALKKIKKKKYFIFTPVELYELLYTTNGSICYPFCTTSTGKLRKKGNNVLRTREVKKKGLRVTTWGRRKKKYICAEM